MPVEMLIVKKKNVQKYMTNLPYLKNFVKPVETSNMSVKSGNDLICLAETEEVASQVIDKTIGELLV